MIAHARRQYPVGQGCFHVGFVGAKADDMSVELDTAESLLGGVGVRYVYDCGAMAKYKGQRDLAIDAYLTVSHRQRIDFLFLSHMHEDHISGVERLCDTQNGGAQVDTIVLPLLNVIDRIICFARAIAEDEDYASPFHLDLTVEPATALTRFNPRQIIFVRRGPEGGAPPRGETLIPRDPTPGMPQDRRDVDAKREGLTWSMVGAGYCKDISPQDIRIRRGRALPPPEVFEVDDTYGFAIANAALGDMWILAPYVDPEVSSARTAFVDKAADLLGMTAQDFEAEVQETDKLRTLVTKRKAELAKAYSEIADLNVTSLSLFSGPLQVGTSRWQAKMGPIEWRWSADHKVGWLGTGDADLKKLTRRQVFLAHYTSYLSATSTLLLPHHGSERNFDPELLETIAPRMVVAAADAYGKWRHPGSAVIQAASSHGVPLWTVTSASLSQLDECVWTPWPQDDV